MIKNISEKIDLYMPVTSLFIFALLLGIEVGLLNDNLSYARSIINTETIISLYNIFWAYVAAVFLFFALKAKAIQLKIAYFIGGISLILTPSIVRKIDLNGLYIIKVVLLFTSCSIFVRYITKTISVKWTNEEYRDL
jgi:hypothetical protein